MGLWHRDRRGLVGPHDPVLGPDHPALVALRHAYLHMERTRGDDLARLDAMSAELICAVHRGDHDDADRIEADIRRLGLRIPLSVTRRTDAAWALLAVSDVHDDDTDDDTDAVEAEAVTPSHSLRAPSDDPAVGPRTLAVTLTVAPGAPHALTAG